MRFRLAYVALLTSSIAFAQSEDSCAPYKQYACPDGKHYPIHLTFDDGPDLKNTPKVLDALKAEDVKATFFVIGEKFEKTEPVGYLKLVKRELAEGHTVGSHSYHHVLHVHQTDEQIQEWITRVRTVGTDRIVDGKPMGPYLAPILRLPYGSGWYDAKRFPEKSQKIMSILKENGFRHMGWDISADDWDKGEQENPGILAIVSERVCTEGGGIILFHDVQSNTAAHIREWIQALKCAGHEFVPITYYLPDLKKTQLSWQERVKRENLSCSQPPLPSQAFVDVYDSARTVLDLCASIGSPGSEPEPSHSTEGEKND